MDCSRDDKETWLRDMLLELAAHPNDLATSMLLSCFAVPSNYVISKWYLRAEVFRMSKQHMAKLLKGHMAINKHWRLSLIVATRLMGSHEYGEVSYLNTSRRVHPKVVTAWRSGTNTVVGRNVVGSR
eukprot:298793-Amphidinium_carterae.1